MDMSENKKHRDHRELGQLLDLFSFQEIAPGAPFWHPNGMIIFRELENLARQINDSNGYDEISTPIIVKDEVFKKSGHWDHYRQNMFYFTNPVDKNEHLAIKPMNCPESTYIYNSTIRSYRDLPLRLAEIGRLHRNELSGTLGGMFRVRQITMDDAHIYCSPDQVEKEITHITKIIEKFYAIFDLKPTYVLATRPEKFLGEKSEWDKAETALKKAMDESGIKYEIQAGEGAFYGPKIEVHLKDSQNRDWQMGTAQLDLVMLPKQFETYYIDENGDKKMPWVIHRAVFGSFERFIGMILEHFDGALPAWLSPIQVSLIPIGEKHNEYAQKLVSSLKSLKIRAKLNDQNMTMGKKIRETEIRRIPFMAVVGDKEIENKTVSLRSLDNEKSITLSLEEFLKEISKKTKTPFI
ncbi:MAG: threonine--tRNA ligase [Patescibacteria group bacterium]